MSDHADAKTFKLKKPIEMTVDGVKKSITEITLKEPLALHIEAAEDAARKIARINDPNAANPQISNANFVMQMISSCSEPKLSLVQVRNLASRDFAAMRACINDFLDDAPAGEN